MEASKAERWRRMKEILTNALEMPSEARRAYIEEACGGDQGLVKELELLLEADAADDAIPIPGAAGGLPGLIELANWKGSKSGTAEGPSTAMAGHRIGRFTITRLIGVGGMGTVYEARQDEPDRLVAIKVLRWGLTSPAAIRRFEFESRALARMKHPGIAQIYEAGIDTAEGVGVPYFVMEHIRGESILEHCDRHGLDIRHRLQLFAQVCDAVHHAHMQGIIHRDIKPSNILVGCVDSTPERPVVIDFGVAKTVAEQLTDETAATRHGQVIGTPEYMSPEQAELTATGVDTRTDVYSLGVVLYELLTGAKPFDHSDLKGRGHAPSSKSVHEREPPTPSNRLLAMGPRGIDAATARATQVSELAARLRSELEWIPMKAMRLDRSERYRSAAELGDDIANYLAGRPLLAAADGTRYRIRKFVKRHKGAVTAAVLLIALLVAGVAGTSWGLLRAKAKASEAKIAAAATVKALAEKTDALQAETKARKAAEYEAYVAHLAVADASLAANEPVRLRTHLDACSPQLRNWEWRYLDAQSDQSLAVLRGHSNILSHAEFNPSRTRILTVSHDNTARLWDAVTGKELFALRGHEATVQTGAFSASGDRIVTTSNDRTARVWDAATGRELYVLRGHEGAVWGVKFSPTMDRLVTASEDRTARIWDATNGKELFVLRGHAGWVLSPAFNPTGDRILTASWDNTARLWDTSNGQQVTVLRGHGGAILSAAFDPSGKRVVTSSLDKTARIWDAATGTELAVLRGHTEQVTIARFSPAGDLVVTGSDDNTARVWNATTGQEVEVLRGHLLRVIDVVFSPQGNRIVSASWDRTVRVWDAATGHEQALLRGHAAAIQDLTLDPSGEFAVTASDDNTARIWRVKSAPELDVKTNAAGRQPFAAIGPSADSVMIAAEFAPAQPLSFLEVASPVVFPGYLPFFRSGALSPFGDRFIDAFPASTPKVCDSSSGMSAFVLRGHGYFVKSAVFSPLGERILTGSWDKTARIWDAVTGRELRVFQGHERWVQSALFNPAGDRVVTASWDGTARVWDAATGSCLQVLHASDEGPVNAAAFSKNGTRIVTGSFDQTVRVWSADTGELLQAMRGHEGQVLAAAFNKTGDRIVTGSDDNTARVWDAMSGRELVVLRGHTAKVEGAMFGPDDSYILTASADRSIRVWDGVRLGERFAQRVESEVEHAVKRPSAGTVPTPRALRTPKD